MLFKDAKVEDFYDIHTLKKIAFSVDTQHLINGNFLITESCIFLFQAMVFN